jgi:hypothetical protein
MEVNIISADQWQAIRCLIQANHTLVTERAQAYLLLCALAEPGRSQVITAADELDVYDEACKHLSKGQDGGEMSTIICKIRLAAVRAKPKDENLAVACFRACLKRCNWDYAQQVRLSSHLFHIHFGCHIVGIAPIFLQLWYMYDVDTNRSP